MASQLLLLSWVATSLAGGSQSPQLVQLEVRIGVSEAPVRAVVEKELPALAECIAFARIDGHGRAAPIDRDADLDDRVEVTLQVQRGRDAEPPTLRAEVQSVLSDADCVKRRVAKWKLPAAVLSDLAALKAQRREAPIALTYRFRPDPTARAAGNAEARKGMQVLCAVYQTRPAGHVTAPYLSVQKQLPGRLRERLDGVVEALKEVSAEDVPIIFGAAVHEAGEALGAPVRCPGLETPEAP